MVDDQEAGLCHFGQTYCTIGIHQQEGTRVLKFNHSGTIEWGPSIDTTNLWLRSIWNLRGENRYEYSLDGENFISFGEVYPLGWGPYRGDRVGVYNLNHEREQGYVDVEYFNYESRDKTV